MQRRFSLALFRDTEYLFGIMAGHLGYQATEARLSMGTSNNTFSNSGDGEQNIGQGDGAIGKQENIRQDVKGNRNIVLGTGDAYVEEHHHHYPRTPQGIPLQRPRQPDHLVGREEYNRNKLRKVEFGWENNP
ncbi:MAG: hypothetical protein D3904_13610, partial [Candidatus Electrothrix sp. EH2]|nr:hypothetical protein [Candidatus Electrothrix sp. EH2]